MLWPYDTQPNDPDDISSSFFFRKPSYYDSPEGTQPWEKLWGLNKYAIIASYSCAVVDCFTYSNALTPLKALNVFGFYAVPFLGMATAFVSTTYIATNVRGKNDKFNYFLGGLSCMPILHAWRKNPEVTFWGTALLILIAVNKKYCIDNDIIIFPRNKMTYGNYHDCYDFSIVSEEWPRRPII